jgi:hypothetical protein
LIAFLSLSSLISCEKDITVDLPKGNNPFIIHAQIETDSNLVVNISASSDYFTDIPTNLLTYLAENAVSGAKLILSDGNETDSLLPLQPNNFVIQNWTFFNYRSTKIIGKVNKTYTLKVIHPLFEAEATTTIPENPGVDSLWWEAKINTLNLSLDSQLVRLMYRYKDPITPGNCVRAFTRRFPDTTQFWTSDFRSIYEDGLINGGTVIFPIRRGKENVRFGLIRKDYDRAENGYFRRGDTIQLKWCAIDRPSFDFWRTTEAADGGSGNPFRSPVYMKTNWISKKGSVSGVFCGYGSQYYQVIVPKL